MAKRSAPAGTKENPITLNDDQLQETEASTVARRSISLGNKHTIIHEDDSSDLESHESFSELAETFNLFSSLPKEVRLMIWRSAFPGSRHFYLGNQITSWSPAQEPLKEETKIQRPVTLHVNHESRMETLKHYGVLFENPFRTGGYDTISYRDVQIPKKLLCLNPAQDMPHIVLSIERSTIELSRERLAKLDTTLPGGLKMLTRLEIRLLMRYYVDFEDTISDFRVKGLSSLINLQGLEELYLVSHHNGEHSSFLPIKNLFTTFFEEHKDEFLSGNAPKVLTRYWEPLRYA